MSICLIFSTGHLRTVLLGMREFSRKSAQGRAVNFSCARINMHTDFESAPEENLCIQSRSDWQYLLLTFYRLVVTLSTVRFNSNHALCPHTLYLFVSHFSYNRQSIFAVNYSAAGPSKEAKCFLLLIKWKYMFNVYSSSLVFRGFIMYIVIITIKISVYHCPSPCVSECRNHFLKFS
jgi:hypothetical protein